MRMESQKDIDNIVSEKFVSIIYKHLLRFDSRISLIDVEDCKQEIRFALLTSKKEEVFKVASRLVQSLLSSYGYSRRKGKDNFSIFYTDSQFTEIEEKVLQEIEILYLEQNMTAREIAHCFNIEYNNSLQKILCACFPKQMGKGGKRKGAGKRRK
jgi:hypothetical protein